MFHKMLQLMMKIPLLQNIRLLFYFFDSFILLFIKKPGKQSDKKKVLVVFTHALGDSVMFYGSIPYIFEIYPRDEYEVTVSCHTEYMELFRTEFDHVLPIDYRRASISPWYRIQFLRKMREKYYDIAIDPIGSEECSPNVYAMYAVCAQKKIGVLTAQDKKYQCPQWLREKIYTEIIYKPMKNIHKVRHYAEVWSEIAGNSFEPRVARLPVLNTMTLPENYFVVYPSASIPVKRWPVEKYAWIAKKIYEKTGWTVVCCGREADREITDKFISFIRNEIPYENKIGKTTVLQLIEMIGKAQMVLTNDTSIYHIAVATGRKVCVVSGGYAYDTFLNYLNNGYGSKVEEKIRIAAGRCDYINCYNDCKYKVGAVYPCVERMTEQEVWTAVEQLIAAVV